MGKSRSKTVHPADQEMKGMPTHERFLRQVLDINPNLIFAKDREGRFTLVNKAVADIYGTTVEGLIGKTDADFNPDPEQVAFFRRIDLQVMDTLQELVIPEEVITDAAGKRHWLQTVKRPILDADNVANQVLGVATDITHRRELEEQLRQAQKMEAIGQLAGGIAHDFNNMLAVILGNAERLLSQHGRVGDRSLLDSLELIQSAGTRAAELVSQLLTFSRKLPVAPIVLNLGEVVATIHELLQTLCGEFVQLVIHRNDADAHVRMDRGALEQLIVNLVVNARDAMPTGGKVVIDTTVSKGATTNNASHVASGPCVMLTVSDSGVGIPPDIINRIFEPFFSTKAARGKGTGLGLSIAYGIVHQAGGYIGVESTPGRGTTFRILVPAVSDPPTASAKVTCPDPIDGHETILVCEDEPGVLRLISDILKDHGYHVLEATHGAEAAERARAHKGEIHLLVTDVVMPGMTGRQLADVLGKDRPNVKVVFITGYPANVLGSVSNLKLRHRVLAKPFPTAALLDAVRRLLVPIRANGTT